MANTGKRSEPKKTSFLPLRCATMKGAPKHCRHELVQNDASHILNDLSCLKKKKKLYFTVPCGMYRSPYVGKAQQPQEQRYPFLSVCAVFSCVQRLVWLPVFGIFNMHTDVDACDCTRGLYGHRKRVCTESWLWEKSPLPHQGIEPGSVLHLDFQLDALPTELFHPSTGLRKKTIQWPPKPHQVATKTTPSGHQNHTKLSQKPHQVPKLQMLQHIGIYNNNNNGHFYGAWSLARSRAQCAVQKAAEKCTNTYNGQNKTQKRRRKRFRAIQPPTTQEFTYSNFSK